MGILDTPAVSPSALIQSLRRQGLAIVASNPNALNHSSRNVSGANAMTFRTEHFATADASGLRLVFGNWYWGSAGVPNTNPIMVKATLERLSPLGANTNDQQRIPVSFNGARYKVIDGVSIAISDPAPFKIAKGERFYIRTAVSASVFGNAPAAPTLGASTTGGALPSGVQYQVALSYVFPAYETVMGAATQSAATGAGSANQITVTSPAAAGGALGYRVWMTAAGGSASSTFYSMSPVVPFGTTFANLYAPNTASKSQTNQVGFPLGNTTLGWTSFYGIDNGEGNNTVTDVADNGGGAAINPTTGYCYSPVGILGTPSGALPPSPVMIGDSIKAGKGDDGLSVNRGGATYRALAGITTSTITSATSRVPAMGFMSAGPIPGEKIGTFIDAADGAPRQLVSLMGSSVLSDYGTNDLAGGSAELMVKIMRLANLYTPSGVKFIQETFVPKTTSTDGWRTVASQTVNADNGYRVVLNNWFRSSANAGSQVTTEAATHGAADGNAKAFQPSQAFITGTETVYVNGTATSAYTYTDTALMPDGTTKAAGEVIFSSAPANGATVTFTYTSVPGFKAACAKVGSGLADIFDVCSPVEVNSSGALTPNGGFWLPAPAGSIDTGTVTSANSTSITDSTKAWQVSGGANAGQKGACVRIISDSTTPAAAGQVFCIAYNSATQLNNLSTPLTTVPSNTATYEIYRPYTVDGVHPSSDGYRLMATMVDTSKIK